MVKKFYYTQALLRNELEKCLNCSDKPCQKACPIGCDPSSFIKKAKEHHFFEAAKLIREKNPLGEVCGLVCPSKFCMRACTRSKIDFSVNIPKIQATILKNTKNDDFFVCPAKKEKMAVVGGGPAGIGAAVTFAKNGFQCTLFDENEKIGGMINLIPSSRLPVSAVEKEINNILLMPFLKIKTNEKIKQPAGLLAKGYDYVVIATGAGIEKKQGIPGEKYMVSCFDFLKKSDCFSSLKKVAVIGAGNVALDCITLLREKSDCQIDLFMRRPVYMMRVEKERVLELIENQVNLHSNAKPVKIEKQKNKLSLFVARTMIKNNCLVETDEIGLYDDFDLIIKAIGGHADKQMSHPKVFYAGESKGVSSSVVEALADGIQTAHKIIDPLLNLK